MAEIAQTFSIDPYAAERSKIARQQKFAELLQSQALQPNEKFSYAGIEAPISAAGGLAKALQAGMSGYLQGDAARKEDAANIKQETDYNAANEAFIRGMSAKPWVNPDTGGAYHLAESGDYDTPDPSKPDERMPIMNRVPTAPAGGLEGATEALAGLQGNHYAGRLSQALMMKKAESDTAAQQAAAERAAQFRNAVALKQTPGDQPTPPEMQGYQYDVKNNGFQGSFAEWSRSKSAPKAPQHITTAEGVFELNPDGSLGRRLGSPASQFATPVVPSEGERKAATLWGRLQNSQAQLNVALGERPDAATPGVFASIVNSISPTLGNTVTPEARQRVEAAQLDILDAALTLGTGAAYTREQLEGYRRSFFPQIGDEAKTIEDKKSRLQSLINSAEIAAGRSAPLVIKPPVAADSPPPNLLAEGTETTFSNGQVWTLQNGKSVRVK